MGGVNIWGAVGTKGESVKRTNTKKRLGET